MFGAEIEPDSMHLLYPSYYRSIREARPILSFVTHINEQLQSEAMQKRQDNDATAMLFYIEFKILNNK